MNYNNDMNNNFMNNEMPNASENQESTKKPYVAPQINGLPDIEPQVEVEQPVQEEVQEQPVQEEVQEQPVQEEVQEQPVQEEVQEQPVQEEVQEQPVQEEVYEQLVQEEVQEQPVQEEVYEQLVQEEVQEQPVQEVVYEQPVQEVVYEQPVQEVVYEQPVYETPYTAPAYDDDLKVDVKPIKKTKKESNGIFRKVVTILVTLYLDISLVIASLSLIDFERNLLYLIPVVLVFIIFTTLGIVVLKGIVVKEREEKKKKLDMAVLDGVQTFESDGYPYEYEEARFEYKKGEKSKTSNSLFDDEMPFTDYFINFSNYAKERGINIEPNSLRQLIAGIGSSKIMFIKSKNKELAKSILKLLSEYLGSQFYSDVANDNWTNLSDLKWRVENGLYYETAFFQGIEAAISDYKAISIIGLENVDVNTMNSYFEPFLKYANEPNLDNYVTIANPTRKVTDSYKLTNNIWFAIFAKSNDFELPVEYAQTSVVVELNAVEVEKSEELSENKFKFIPFTRFNECLLEDEDNNTISEDLWKKVDALDDYIARVAKFKIENKLFIQLEKYVTAYILCKGDKNDALDNCILNKLLPIFKTLEFKISEGSEDEDLLATVDNIFGLENLNKSQEYLRKINQEKF